jgi:hypothetical protein
MKRKAREINQGGGGGGGLFGKSFGRDAAAVAVGSKVNDVIGQIAGAAMKGSESLRQMTITAQALGTTVPDLNEVTDSLEVFGISAEETISILEKIENSRQTAIDGNKGMAESFAAVGASMDDLIGSNAVKEFERISKALASGGGKSFESASEIIGKRALIGKESAMTRYGGGFRKENAFEPTQREADLLLLSDRKRLAAITAAQNVQAKATAHTFGQTISDSELDDLKKIRAEESKSRKEREQQRSDAAKKARADAITAKEDEIRREFTDRQQEAMTGIRGDRLPGNEFQRIGIGLGSHAPDSGIGYESGRKQAEIAQKALEIEKEMNKALQKIADKFSELEGE